MKYLAIVAGLALTLAPNAFAKTITSYSFNKTMMDDQVRNLMTYQVTLDDNRELKVQESTYEGLKLSPKPISQRDAMITLAPAVFNTLLTDMISLSSAEIETRHQTIVCMMMPLPSGPNTLEVATKYSYDTLSFHGALRTILTKEGCYLQTHTGPREERDRTQAKSLERALEVLSLQALSQE